jgi:hypothetical protein
VGIFRTLLSSRKRFPFASSIDIMLALFEGYLVEIVTTVIGRSSGCLEDLLHCSPQPL